MPFGPIILFLGTYLEEIIEKMVKGRDHEDVHCNIICMKKWKQAKYPEDKGIQNYGVLFS